ncbi:MAG: hypothetical protein V3W37_08130 [Candidatus Binatia bacterium]
MVLAEFADWILSAGAILFSLALIPMAWKRVGQVTPIYTSASTAAVLWVYAALFADLGLLYSALTGAATASLWTILLGQRILFNQRGGLFIG